MPGSSIAGSSPPPKGAPLGAVQEPTPSGFPPSWVTNMIGAFELQSVIVASVPASGGVLSFTVTVAEELGQGAEPFTV